ncbi:MAG: hypothetical protein ACI4SS_04560 [Clostridia bacterium]
MKEFVFGEYVICADSAKTRRLYDKRGPHFLKCACPGCQNFFKSVKPYRNEIEAYLSPLGIEWSKPDEIRVLCAAGGSVTYGVTYSFYGKRKSAPQKWTTEKNEMGSINVRNPSSVFKIDEVLSFSFRKCGRGRTMIEIRAELPWVMETLNCIYDDTVSEYAKKIPNRAERIYRAARTIAGGIKGAE